MHVSSLHEEAGFSGKLEMSQMPCRGKATQQFCLEGGSLGSIGRPNSPKDKLLRPLPLFALILKADGVVAALHAIALCSACDTLLLKQQRQCKPVLLTVLASAHLNKTDMLPSSLAGVITKFHLIADNAGLSSTPRVAAVLAPLLTVVCDLPKDESS